jgi:hypothetical protein
MSDNISVNSGQSRAGNESPPLQVAVSNMSANPSNPANAGKEKDIGVKFTVKHAFGSHATKLDPLQSFAALGGNKDYSDRLVHKVGKQVCIYDPDSNVQEFFDSRPRNVVDVLHFTISANARYISMCESIKHEKGSNEATSQVSVYSLSTLNRLKTLHYTLPRPFMCSVFCGDPKLIAALSDEPDRHIVVWYWEKEKVYKTCAISLGASVLRSAPCMNLMLTTSGPSAFKNWCIAPDGSLKPSNFLPPAKESLDVYSDHIWLPSNLNNHRMVTLVDPDPSNEINKNRKQSVYIFEGTDNTHSTSSGSIAPIIPILMELKQTVLLKLEPNCRIERIVPNAKAFLLVGTMGLICLFERTDDKHDPYIESKRFSLGDLHITGATVYPSEERMVVLTKSNRLLNMSMDITIEQIKKGAIGNHSHEDDSSQHSRSKTNKDTSRTDGGKSSHQGGNNNAGDDNASASSTLDKTADSARNQGITDIIQGGYHTSAILAADIAYERPLIATIGADAAMRIWNYQTEKCDLVHYFRNDEPLTCALHSSGFQVLVSFKDRIRLFNILMDKIKQYRETVIKNCKCLKFSNGSQYFAAASAINVMVYETKSFTQLMNFQGHMMTVVKLSWAPGDQVLFSAGLDGNVYGWPINKDGKIEVIAANNRSSAILDIAIDCSSTVFPTTTKESALHRDEEIISPPTGGKGGSNSNAIAKEKEKAEIAANLSNALANVMSNNRSWLIVSSLDGHIRLPNWNVDQVKLNNAGGYSHQSAQGQSTALTLHSQANQKIYPVLDSHYVLFGDSSISITSMQLSNDRGKLFVGTSTGALRIYPWPPEPGTVPLHNSTIISTQLKGGDGVPSTANSSSHQSGGHHGHHGAHGPTAAHPLLYYEIFTHAGPVIALRQGPLESTIISAGADGSIFIHLFHDDRPRKTATGTGGAVSNALANIIDPFENADDQVVLNQDVILLAFEDVEEHVNQVVELQKLLSETRVKNEFHSRKLEFEHNEALKRITEVHDLTLNREKENYEKQRLQFDKRIRELMITIEQKESDHIKIITELENKYEHKLAEQLERYDLLSEKMTLLKQKCEGLLESEKSVFLKQITDIKNESSVREKKLRIENRRAVEDKIANESAFREIINQQEDEYEDELKQLIKAAEGELITERETILKLRTLVQTKNTKLDQLKKKFLELQTASKARMTLLEQERLEKQRLLDTIEHYKLNLIEREDALAEKEKTVLELRSKTRTLENFRFVLDHRLQQLSAERGPITSHIEGLEKHIATMYEELVEEFTNKKVLSENSVIKDQKISWISQDLMKMRQSVREKEQYIAGFKRELGNIVSSMVVGKELEESVHVLYRKFVRGESNENKPGPGGKAMKLNDNVASAVNELMITKTTNNPFDKHSSAKAHYTENPDDQSFLSNDGNEGKGNGAFGAVGGFGTLGGDDGPSKSFLHDVEEALIETAKEADRQKKFVERQSHNLKHRLHTHEKEGRLKQRHRLHENSDLLFECNELRSENKDLLRKLAIAEHDLDELKRNVKSTLKGGGGTLSTQPGSPTNANKQQQRGHSPPPTGARPISAGGGGAANPNNINQGSLAVSTSSAPWIVHNSLPVTSPLNSAPTGGFSAFGINANINNKRGADELDSLHSLHGIPVGKQPPPPQQQQQQLPTLTGGGMEGNSAIHLSQSMPHLINQSLEGSIFPNISTSQSHSLLQPANQTMIIGKGASTTKQGKTGGKNNAISIPRPEKLTGNKLKSAQENVIEKLNTEVDSLANQLDESIRERDIQRMELSRLRKQLMHLTNQQQLLQSQISQFTQPMVGLGLGIGGGVSGGHSQQNLNSYPSLHSSLNEGSLPSLGNNNNNNMMQQSLTHADLYGYPSEDEKKEMRIGPSSSMVSKGSKESATNKKEAANSRVS